MQREQAISHRPGRRRWRFILLICALLTPAALRGQDGRHAETSDLRKQADAIRAAADKLSQVRRIPWLTDVFEGFRLAKEENRPVFLYMITGDPLGDC
jgi:hypothetical protein